MKYSMVYTFVIAITFLSACSTHREGPAERAGERTDEIVDNVKSGRPLLHKAGPVEKAGRSLDKAFSGKE